MNRWRQLIALQIGLSRLRAIGPGSVVNHVVATLAEFVTTRYAQWVRPQHPIRQQKCANLVRAEGLPGECQAGLADAISVPNKVVLPGPATWRSTRCSGDGSSDVATAFFGFVSCSDLKFYGREDIFSMACTSQ